MLRNKKEFVNLMVPDSNSTAYPLYEGIYEH